MTADSPEGQRTGTETADPPTSTRIGGGRRPIVPLLVLLAIIGGILYLVLARSSPEQQIRRLMDRQMKLATAERFGQLHATLSARARGVCPRPVFVGELQRLANTEPDFWHLIDVRDIAIQVNGNRAEVTYVITYNGRPVDWATRQQPDVYVRATETILGPKPNLQRALAELEALRRVRPGIGQLIGQKEYEQRKARLLKFGTKRPVVYKKGEWYDDLDTHVRCGT